MARMIIKTKKGKIVILVDKELLSLLENFYKNFNERTGYVQCRLKSIKKAPTITLQRLVAKTPKGLFTHHINHNKNDYRLRNLEILDPKTHSHRQEKHKMHNKKETSSPLIGVTWCAKQEKWYCSMHVSGLHLNLGYYTSLEVAGAVHNYYVIALYGKCAELNKVNVTEADMESVDFTSLNNRVKANLIKKGLQVFADKLDKLKFADVDFRLILGVTNQPK